jgi:hypothetical protein
VNHRALQSQVLLAAILSLLARHASAQDQYQAHWQAFHERQPEALSFQISAAKNEFYSGELIPLQLSFTSTQPKSFLASRNSLSTPLPSPKIPCTDCPARTEEWEGSRAVLVCFRTSLFLSSGR